ncbi:hypothetical protein TSUD_113390 [Trifolium subterraneum]|uniref:Uncharacterized protein n=1 Tax=Trifolium subterraneum TaxID=3900 RepID=A0A2Z6MH75_TRISU|nr:hypothetical protein TSUD_113390 [Trifolium subterraneum]
MTWLLGWAFSIRACSLRHLHSIQTAKNLLSSQEIFYLVQLWHLKTKLKRIDSIKDFVLAEMSAVAGVVARTASTKGSENKQCLILSK